MLWSHYIIWSYNKTITILEIINISTFFYLLEYKVFLLESLTHFSLETPKSVIGNSADPDQMLQNGTSDQGHHCLQTVLIAIFL